MKSVKRIIAQLSLVLMSCSAFGQLNTFFDQWTPRTFTAPSTFTPASEPTGSASVTVNVNITDTIAKVLSTHLGQNIGIWIGDNVVNDARKDHLKRSNLKYIRYPGGNLSNRFFWDGNLPTITKVDPVLVSKGIEDGLGFQISPDEMLEICDSMDAEMVPCVNVSYAIYGPGPDPVGTAAHYAADWVRYMNITLGRGIKYWEVGNENYGSWQAGWSVDGDTLTGTEYGNLFKVFVDSMKAADPSIKIGAVLHPDDGAYSDWSKLVLEKVENHADFLVIHEYFHPSSNKNNLTYNQMMAEVTQIAGDYSQVQTMVSSYTSKAADYFPIAMTEFNSRSGRREKAMANALFNMHVVMEQIKSGFGLSMMWDIQNGTDAEGGDHGFLAKNDNELADFEPRPTYTMYHLLGNHLGDHLLNTSSTHSDVKAYASSFDNEEMGMILINTGSATRKTEVVATGMQYGANMYWHELYATTEADSQFYINGQTGPVEGGPVNYETIDPYGRAINGNTKFDLKPYSIYYVTFETDVFIDCNGDTSGSAYLDSCAVCVGGNTGLNPCISICNPGFESALANWQTQNLAGTTANWSDDNTEFNSGAASMKVETPDTHSWAVRITSDCPIMMDSSKNYQIKFWAKSLAGTGRIKSVFANTANSGITNTFNFTPITNAWTEYSYILKPDSNLSAARIRFMFAEAGTYWLDDVSIAEVEQDCNGDWGGTAFMDSCAQCAGGLTGITPILDPMSCITSTEISLSNELIVVPNPFSNEFLLKTTSGSDIKSVKVYDTRGVLVHASNSPNSNQIKILANWPSGMYNILVTSEGDQVSSTRIVKK